MKLLKWDVNNTLSINYEMLRMNPQSMYVYKKVV